MPSSNDRILFSLVSRGKTLLAEYTDKSIRSGNFKQVALRILERIDLRKNHRASYAHDGFIFHYLCENSLIFMVMADEGLKNRRPFAFLEDIKSRWFATYQQRHTTAKHYEMQGDFSPVLQRQMEYFTNSPTDSIARISRDLSDLQSVCMTNIEKILDRGERVELLVDRSEGLSQTARSFNKRANQVRKAMWWQNVKSTLMLILVGLIILYIIVAMFCGLTLSKCF
ncbi:hypothetical protein P9112_003456 [Eukaryota sp. TZLM1-RC]